MMQKTGTRLIPGLIIAIFVMTLTDAACTYAGVSLGVISEGNPLLQSGVAHYPVFTCLAAVLYTAGLLAVIWIFGHRCRFTVPLLIGLTAVKAAIIGMHVYWMALFGIHA